MPREGKPFACPVKGCLHRCNQKANLRAHTKIHLKIRDTALPPGGKFECAWEECDHTSETVVDMETHMVTHMGDNFRETTFESTWGNCGHKTNNKHSFAKHMNTHTREIVFRCDEVGCD